MFYKFSVFLFKISDRQELPQHICYNCVQKIREFHDFYKSVIFNQESLEKLNYDRHAASDEEPSKEMISEFEDDQNSPKISHKTSTRKTIQKPNKEISKKRRAEDERIAKYISFKCSACPTETLSNLKEWSAHQRKVHNEKLPVITCCERKLRDRKRILDHISYHHELTPQFECPNCQRHFKRRPYLLSHMRSHTIQTTEKLKCDHCSEEFIYQSQLTKHQLTHMPLDERKLIQLFTCDQCQNTYTKHHQLLTHRRRMHDQPERYTFICHICAKKFNKKERLEDHLLDKHSSNPPKHACEICGVVASSREALRRHMKWYHTDGGSEEHVCDICGAVRKNEMSLKQHRRFMHETKRTHTCEYCMKAFKRAYELTEHLTIHVGGTLYSCPHCERGFNSRSNMQSHAKRRCQKNPTLHMVGSTSVLTTLKN